MEGRDSVRQTEVVFSRMLISSWRWLTLFSVQMKSKNQLFAEFLEVGIWALQKVLAKSTPVFTHQHFQASAELGRWKTAAVLLPASLAEEEQSGLWEAHPKQTCQSGGYRSSACRFGPLRFNFPALCIRAPLWVASVVKSDSSLAQSLATSVWAIQLYWLGLWGLWHPL